MESAVAAKLYAGLWGREGWAGGAVGAAVNCIRGEGPLFKAALRASASIFCRLLFCS
jgi:hypothetical protein